MNVYDKSLVTVLGVSLFLILVALPLALRKVRRNVVYGFRTRATLGSDEIWYAANAHFGRGLIVAALCGALAGIVACAPRLLPPEAVLPVSTLVMALPGLIAALATLRYIARLQCSDGERGVDTARC